MKVAPWLVMTSLWVRRSWRASSRLRRWGAWVIPPSSRIFPHISRGLWMLSAVCLEWCKSGRVIISKNKATCICKTAFIIVCNNDKTRLLRCTNRFTHRMRGMGGGIVLPEILPLQRKSISALFITIGLLI